MKPFSWKRFYIYVATLLLCSPLGSTDLLDRNTIRPIDSQDLFARLPISFEVNRGQTDSSVQYLARCRGYIAYFRKSEVIIVAGRQRTRSLEDLRRSETGRSRQDQIVHRLTFPGAKSVPAIQPGPLLAGKSNYFIGKRVSKWLTNIPNYSQIRYGNLYPGIDLVFTGVAGRLKYDFVVAPGADPSAIRLSVDVTNVALND